MRQVVHRGAPDPSQSVSRRLLLPWLLLPLLAAEEAPPADLALRVAARETESEAARNQYTYRQTVRIDEMDSRGVKVGEYSEIRDIVFSPSMERSERPIGKPRLTLVRLKLTAEDFRDLREVQPLLLTADRLPLYETRYRGEESIDGIAYFVLQVRPRQILADQRLFDGLLWIDKRDYSIVRSAGQAVPQVLSTRSENLFPRFTTVRRRMEQGYWFPVMTYADDTLPFRTGPLRLRMRVDYADYRRFGSESPVRLEGVDPK